MKLRPMLIVLVVFKGPYQELTRPIVPLIISMSLKDTGFVWIDPLLILTAMVIIML